MNKLTLTAALLLASGCFETPTVRVDRDDARVAGDAGGSPPIDASFDPDGAPPDDYKCSKDADCPFRLASRCDEETHSCAPCQTSSQCSFAGNTVCIYDQGCFECKADGTCATGEVCNSATHSCVECIPGGEDECADTPNTPECHPELGKCVECVSNTDCESPSESKCGDTHECVECDGPEDCTHIGEGLSCYGGKCAECGSDDDCASAERPHCSSEGVCEPCEEGTAECGHLQATTVCMAGGPAGREGNVCVECTRDERGACSGPSDNKDICNALTHECVNGVKPGTAPLCGVCPEESVRTRSCNCFSDDDCPSGSACVEQRLADQNLAGWFCMPLDGGALCKRPFAGRADDVSTIEGSAADICSLRVSSCEAHDAYSRVPCTSDEEPGQGDNSKCGRVGIDDGYCVNAGNVLGWICTVPCNNNAADCPDVVGTSDPLCVSQSHAGSASGFLCTL